MMKHTKKQKKQPAKAKAKAVAVVASSSLKQRQSLWVEVVAYHTKAMAYNTRHEWLSAYYNLLLASLACKHYAELLLGDGGGGATGETTPSKPPKTHARTKRTLVCAIDPAAPVRSLEGMYATIPLYQAKLRRFQGAFGCPKAHPPTQRGVDTGTDADADADADAGEDCSSTVAVDLSADPAPVFFDDLIGNQIAKQGIEDGVLNPIFMPLLYPNQAKAVLFYGPPGTGKTLLARAAAFELNRRSDALRVLFFAPTADQFKGKFVGETEAKIVNLFRCASRLARAEEARLRETAATRSTCVQSVIFIDEIDSLARRRDAQSGANATIVASATNTLLQTMDGMQSYSNVIVLAATNYPWNIDSAVLRRFGQKIYVPLPPEADIVALLQKCIVNRLHHALPAPAAAADAATSRPSVSARMPVREQFLRWQALHNITEAQLEVLASEMSSTTARVGFSPRDIVHMCSIAFKRESEKALRDGKFYPVVLKPGRVAATATATAGQPAEHPSETSETTRRMLRSLQGVHVSCATFEHLTKHFSHAVDTTVSPAYVSRSSALPTAIIEARLGRNGTGGGVADADPPDHRRYTEHTHTSTSTSTSTSTHTRTHTSTPTPTPSFPAVQLPPKAGAVGIYVCDGHPGHFLLHRVFKVYVRNQTHVVPFFLTGVLLPSPSPQLAAAAALPDAIDLKALFARVRRATFVYDGRLYEQTVGAHAVVRQKEFLKPRAAPILIDESTQWLQQWIAYVSSAASSSSAVSNAPLQPPHPTAVSSSAARILSQFVTVTHGKGTGSDGDTLQDKTTTVVMGYADADGNGNGNGNEKGEAAANRRGAPPARCVHVTYSIQTFLNAFHEVHPSSKLQNVRALDTYQRTGEIPAAK
jgi:SpoVK/Ycf46/Vps4 family AAA+-type ATPase